MSRARDAAFDFDAITIEGGLLPADWLARVAALAAPLRWLRYAPDGRSVYGITQNGKAVLAWPLSLEP